MKPRNFEPLERRNREIPQEKLLDILMGIYPEDMAVEIFTDLTRGEARRAQDADDER